MILFNYSGNKRETVENYDVTETEKPVMIFLGGLLHLQDLDTAGGFHGFLHKLRGNADADIFFPTDETIVDTDALESYMNAYNHDGVAPSNLAQDIYATFIKPLIKEESVSLDNKDAIKQRVSNINLVGYSYGTSLAQQISEIMAKDLFSMTDSSIENPAVVVADICSSVKALNIGTVNRFKHITAEGEIESLDFDDPYYEDALTLFSQLSFFMKEDKIAQRSLGRTFLYGKEESAHGIEVHDTTTTSTLVDYVGEPVHRGLGTTQLPSGRYFPKIITAYDFIMHDMRTYMNIDERQSEKLRIFPSMAISPVLRSASQAMLKDGVEGQTWLAQSRKGFASEQARADLVNSYQNSRNTFEKSLREFEKITGIHEGAAYIQQVVDAAPVARKADVSRRFNHS